MNELLQTAEENVLNTSGLIVDGDYWVDESTGEVVGFAHPEPPEGQASSTFVIDTVVKAEWVLEKMQAAEAAIKEAENHRAYVQARAIIAQHEQLIKPHQKKLEWLHKRFDGELGEFAHTVLGGKTGTWKTLYGSVKLTATKEKLKEAFDGSALAWAKANATNAVKVVESFLVSMLTPEQAAKAKESSEFEVVPAGYNVKVGGSL
jgi:hypothetical protein